MGSGVRLPVMRCQIEVSGFGRVKRTFLPNGVYARGREYPGRLFGSISQGLGRYIRQVIQMDAQVWLWNTGDGSKALVFGSQGEARRNAVAAADPPLQIAGECAAAEC